MSIGERIKNLRNALDLTQEDLAAAAKTTKQAIYKYETGIVTNIPASKIQAIAERLNTTPAYLMGWDEPANNAVEKEKDSPQDFSFYYELSEESQAKLKEFAQFLLARQNKE